MSTEKIILSGFNNISKSVIASFYHIAYTPTAVRQQDFLEVCNEHYSAQALEGLLNKICHQIGATVLFASQKAYAPLGASATMLIAEETPTEQSLQSSRTDGKDEKDEAKKPDEAKNPFIPRSPDSMRKGQVLHLDKSHLAAHTYPEGHDALNLATFRIDLDLSTCGEVNPLDALETLLHDVTPDVFTLDIRTRGFTRDLSGQHCFSDKTLITEEAVETLYRQVTEHCPYAYKMHETLLEKHRTLIVKGLREGIGEEASSSLPNVPSTVVLKAKFQPPEAPQALPVIMTEAEKLFSLS